MKNRNVSIILCMMLMMSLTAFGQMIKRTDVIWARTTSNPITLDGKLLEADWAKAESLQIGWGQENGMPGSGYTTDGWPVTPTDPVRATIKFLVWGDSLYVAVAVKDSSIGGGGWPGPFHWDGILSNMRNKSKADRPVPNGEIYYAWTTESWADTATGIVGAMPGYLGQYPSKEYIKSRWLDSADGLPKAKIWDAKTFVDGLTNADSIIDKGYTVEFKINLKFYGYDAKAAVGDIVMYSLAVFDADWQWFRGADTVKNRFTVSKAWAQGPWGGNNNSHMRVFVNPSVTTTSGAVPIVGPDLVIPNGTQFPAPTIDGKLTDLVWKNANIGKLKLQYGNSAYRNAYPNTAPFRSGQFQPDVNGGKAAIIDANDATVKYFFIGDTLYLGFDVKDKVVQAVPKNLDRWDGFRVMLASRDARDGDSVLVNRNLTFIVDSVGGNGRYEDLSKAGWDSLGQAVQVKLSLNSGTTVDTLGAQVDSGYTAEMKINLRKFGYPAGRGDGVVFLGICMFDGDSFDPPSTSYGSRVWFMREQTWQDGAAWLYMDPSAVLGVGQEESASIPKEFKLYGNYPNPFNPSTTIKFSLPQSNDVTLEVFDVLGRLVAIQNLGIRQAGVQEVSFNASRLSSGVYNYRLRTAASQELVGRMVLVK
ncbi:MAG: T9SS type A sorting domain-containing protein [Bacteroidota bacterium]|nr:T9SS type A sorting domain-containing protein [Bacteroidota bacterium]